MPSRLSNDERRRLTPRELEFVAMAVQGLPNKHIARACGVSDRTVANTLNSAYRKLGVANRWEAKALGMSLPDTAAPDVFPRRPVSTPGVDADAPRHGCGS